MSVTVDTEVVHHGNTDDDPSAFRSVFEHNFTFASAVERNTHRLANRPAISGPSTARSYSCRELGEVTGALVAGPREQGIGDGEMVPGSLRFDELLVEGAPTFRAPADATVWDETSRLYTSGTTGMPKAVPLTSLNEVLTAHDAIIHFPLGPSAKTMNMSPWFHRGGDYCAGPNSIFYVGAEAVCLQQFTADAVLDAVERLKLTYVIGAPTNLERLADEQEANPRIGEVIMRTVKSGYAYRNNPEEEAEKFHDGWIYPGDLASWNENEIVTIIGAKTT